jgi:hypothetical protein
MEGGGRGWNGMVVEGNSLDAGVTIGDDPERFPVLTFWVAHLAAADVTSLLCLCILICSRNYLLEAISRVLFCTLLRR